MLLFGLAVSWENATFASQIINEQFTTQDDKGTLTAHFAFCLFMYRQHRNFVVIQHTFL